MGRRREAIGRPGLVAAVEQAADGVVITDTNGTIQYVNPAFTTMTGYTGDEVVGQNPRILKSGCQSDAVYRELWDTVRSGQVWRGELINRRKDGTLYTEEMRITPVRASNGKVISYIAIKQDVTGRRAAAEAHAFLAAIVENSEDAIVAYTAAGVILTWNRGAELISGYSAGDAIGKHVSMLVPPDRLTELAIFNGQILEGNAASQPNGMCLDKDGRRIHVSVTGSPIRDDAGKVVAISTILRDISEREEAEQARALLASIVESSDDAIHSVTLDGTILTWNRGAELLFGYSSQEVIGKNVAILAPPSRRDEVRQFLKTIRDGHTISAFDMVLQANDGCGVDISLSISPIRNSAGEVVGAAGIARDISERTVAERKLRESEERFREVFEYAPFGMIVSGMDLRIVQVNAAFCRMVGYAEQELLGKAWTDLAHPDDQETALRRRQGLWKDPAGFVDTELRYIHRNGNVVWGRVRVSLVRDSGGIPLYGVVHVEDITERKRTEEALHESEDRFRNIADGCPTMMWVTNAEGGNQFINRAYREFCGITPEQAEGGRWQLLVHPDDASEYIGAFQRAVREQSPFRAEVRIRRADGEWRLLGANAEPRVSPVGEYLGHVGLSADITDRRRAEQALRFKHSLIRAIQEVSLDGILVINRENVIVSHNKKFLEVWRIPRPDPRQPAGSRDRRPASPNPVGNCRPCEGSRSFPPADRRIERRSGRERSLRY